MDGDHLFFDRRGHAEALAARAAACMGRGDFARAFRYADRHCRIARTDALNLLLRAEAARGAGFEDRASADLSRALELDPTQRTVLRMALLRGNPEEKKAAARALIDEPQTDAILLQHAVAECLRDSEALLVLHPLGDRLKGWAAWRAGAAPEIRRDDAAATPLAADIGHFLRQDGVEAAGLDFDLAQIRRVALVRDGVEIANWTEPSKSPPPPREKRHADLWIIVPVYEDFDATRACLTAAMAQCVETGARLVAVDDASPNAPLRSWLDAQATAGRLELIRNPENLGFAASVNRALAICGGGDIILLNADTLPPPGAFARLAALSRTASDIGALTPLSNNGETCSFPAPNASSPLPGDDEIARLGALARRANGDLLIDLPNGIGFCLYITRACLDAVGALPEIYGRGYYEDVEFCLRAREKGFRTVCAAGVYVGHAGSLSFGAQKRRLVMQNMQILAARFPGHEAECAAFLRADPVRSARAAIERLDPPRRTMRLLVALTGAGALEAQAEAQRWRDDGAPAPLLCLYDPTRQTCILRGPGDEAPQSLEFSLCSRQDYADLQRWLAGVDLAGRSLFFSSLLPEAFIDAVAPRGAPAELVIADLEFFSVPIVADPCAHPEGKKPCASCAGALHASPDTAARLRAWQDFVVQRAGGLRALDRMSAHVARSLFAKDVETPAATPDHARASGGRTLALLSPQPSPSGDALVIALARELRRRGDAAELVVFGACLDDFQVMAPGNVLVAGRVADEELAALLAAYGVDAIMSVSRTRFAGRVEALAAACGLAQAAFDWSSGALPLAKDDLALDPRLCDRKIAQVVADWLAARRAFIPGGEEICMEGARA